MLTAEGQVLARVSVIDFQSGLNVYDELVRPPREVTDYRTQWVASFFSLGLVPHDTIEFAD